MLPFKSMIFSQCIWRICNDKQDLTWLTLSKGNISLVNSIELFQQVNITDFALMDFAQPPSKASYDPKLYFQFIKPRVSFHNLWSSRRHHALLIVLVFRWTLSSRRWPSQEAILLISQNVLRWHLFCAFTFWASSCFSSQQLGLAVNLIGA